MTRKDVERDVRSVVYQSIEGTDTTFTEQEDMVKCLTKDVYAWWSGLNTFHKQQIYNNKANVASVFVIQKLNKDKVNHTSWFTRFKRKVLSWLKR